MATVELIPNRLHIYARGPYWRSWTIGADFGGPYVEFSLGPWSIEINWRRWPPRLSDDEQPADVELELNVARAALAAAALPTDEAHERTHQQMDEQFRTGGNP